MLVRDGWAPYRCFRDAKHQSCLAHLLRRCKELQEDHPDSRWAGDVQATLQAGLDLRDRCNAGELSEHGMATARGRLIARLGRLVDAPPPLKDAVRFANHLVTEFLAVFLFLWDPSLDAGAPKVDEEAARVAEEHVEYVANPDRERPEDAIRVPPESLVGAPERIDRLAVFC